MGNPRQHARMGETNSKDVALIDKIGKTGRAGFLVDFAPGIFLFDLEQFGQATPEPFDLRSVEHPR